VGGPRAEKLGEEVRVNKKAGEYCVPKRWEGRISFIWPQTASDSPCNKEGLGRGRCGLRAKEDSNPPH